MDERKRRIHIKLWDWPETKVSGVALEIWKPEGQERLLSGKDQRASLEIS